MTANGPARLPRLTAVAGTDDDVTQMLGGLGAAMLDANQSTAEVGQQLSQVAEAYHRPHLQSVALPTFILVQDDVEGRTSAAVFPVPGEPLRLDQAGAVQRLLDDIIAEPQPPAKVITRIGEIFRMPPRFNTPATILGYAMQTLGFGMLVNPSVAALPAYVGLGLLVGIIIVFGSRLATLSALLSVVTPFVVTIICIKFLAEATGDNALLLIAPPLLTFLPGGVLTLGAMELTDGEIVSGASRLVYGVAQLALLSFGVIAGVVVAGELPHSPQSAPLGWWAPWIGVILVAIGFTIFSNGPKGSLLWIILTLVLAHAAQNAGALAIPAASWLSGFFGAAVLMPFARLSRVFPSAPPTIVTTTCGFQLLVPGAMGFMGLTAAASGHSEGAGLAMMQVGGSVIAIALGMIVGSGLSRDLGSLGHALLRRAPHPESASPSTTSIEQSGEQSSEK